MRVAPIGLYSDGKRMGPDDGDLLGAQACALTHGHEMGYIPGAMLAHIIRLAANHDDFTLEEAVLDAMEAVKKLFADAVHLPAFLRLIENALALAGSDTPVLDAIHTLGEGWVGDEALAIAIYCALKYPGNFERALIAAVNHRGDSDSTGAITGNILGAYLGLSAIPEWFVRNLELADVIVEMADDLYACGDPQHEKDQRWQEKYMAALPGAD